MSGALPFDDSHACPPPTTGRHILVVDDEQSIREALRDLFEDQGYEVREASSHEEAQAAVKERPVDVILLDLRLGTTSGLALLPELKAEQPDAAFIVVTGQATIDTAVEAMQRGADNFVTKPIDPARLLAVVQKGIEAGALRKNSTRLRRLATRAPAPSADSFDSSAMRQVHQLADAVAPHATTVLLLGETGTGKGMLARYIHERSSRAAAPFVELNCAGLTRELTESELFGYEKGAFTGATQRKIGLLEAADGGTLFLDEIGEMEAAVQAKLLKVIEQSRFRRVGGIAEVTVAVRIIVATHRDLERDVSEGRFRADLYYRLNVFAVRLPPLRERLADVLPMSQRFLLEHRRQQSLSTAAAALLMAYAWPGNVRELKNVIERASILAAAGEAILPEHLPPLGGGATSAMTRTPGADPASDGSLAIDTSIPLKEARERWVSELERRYLARPSRSTAAT